MKSDHRHDLKTNDLGKWVAEVGDSAGKYVNQLLIVLIGLLILAGISFYWVRSTAASSAAGWNQMAAARSAEEFANIADKYSGTAVGAWARLKEAELNLESGLRLSFTDRASGLSDLKKARESLNKLVNDASTPEDVMERALFSLGRCLETLSDKNTEEAIAAYQKLLSGYPYTAYKLAAENRITALRTGGAQEFYAWFHDQNPKPADRELPRDIATPGGAALPSGHPSAKDGEKSAPNEKLENDDATKSTPVSSDGSSVESKPVTDSKPAAESKPDSAPTPAKP